MSATLNIAFAGQSNAAGHFYVRSGDRSGGRLGNDIFEAALGSALGTKVQALNLAYSGSGSNQYADSKSYWWDVVANKPGPMLERFVDLLKGRDIDALVWAQGEDDARIARGSGKERAIDNYVEATEATFAYIRKVVGDPQLPIFVQELGTFPKDVALSQYDAIRGAMETIIRKDRYTHFGAETEDLLAHHKDNVHYSNAEYGIIAKRLAASVADQFDTAPAKPSAPPVADKDGSFTSQAGRQSYEGVGSDDVVSYAGSNAKVWINLATGNTQHGHAEGDKLSGIENLIGSRFNDIIKGDGAANRLEGGAGADQLEGAGGRDTLIGGSGNDRLTGGKGADKLIGGEGHDSFVFTHIGDSTPAERDEIVDFVRGQDKIHLQAIDARSGTARNDAFTFIDDDGFSKQAGELRIVTQKGGILVEGDVNGDGKADISIFVANLSSLSSHDFLL